MIRGVKPGARGEGAGSAARIRGATAADHGAIAQLFNRSNPTDPAISAETIAWSDGRADPERPSVRLVATSSDGEIVGHAALRGVPGRDGLLLDLDVDPVHRGAGIGGDLFRALLLRLGDEDHVLWTAALEDRPETLAFLHRRGFRERDRLAESVLDLTAFDPEAHAAARTAALARGIRFSTLADEDSEALRHRIHDLVNDFSADVPAAQGIGALTYAEWERLWLEGPHARPDLLAIALADEMPVAVSYVIVFADGTAYNHTTGVAREYRGRSLGLAIKVEALRLAKAAGLSHIRTDNHARNAPMLAINARIGYRPLPAYIDLVRETTNGVGNDPVGVS